MRILLPPFAADGNFFFFTSLFHSMQFDGSFFHCTRFFAPAAIRDRRHRTSRIARSSFSRLPFAFFNALI